MKVIQVAPVFFGADGVVGGGERYPLELAKALAKLTPTTFISFAKQPRRFREGVIWTCGSTALGATCAAGRPIPSASPGCRNCWAPTWCTRTSTAQPPRISASARAACSASASTRPMKAAAGITGAIACAWDPGSTRTWRFPQFAATTLPEVGREKHVIYGGVDTSRYVPAASTVPNRVLSVGRILPHKGFDVLLQAACPHWDVHIVGTVYHDDYFAHLRRLAEERDLSVTFHTGADDASPDRPLPERGGR